MSFDENKNLRFGVYSKPEYELKYLGKGSTHPGTVFKAVPRGVSIRLAGLTSRTGESENKSLSDLYPTIHESLKSAGYLRGGNKLPKLGDLLDRREQEKIEAELRREEWKKDMRNVYLLSR